MTPRHRVDDELREFLDSTPPSAGMADVHDRLAAKLDTPTGIHDLRELQHQVQRQAIDVAQTRIDAALARADRAESMLRWLAGIVAAVVAIVLGGLILGKVQK
jgi:hypothetical protein